MSPEQAHRTNANGFSEGAADAWLAFQMIVYRQLKCKKEAIQAWLDYADKKGLFDTAAGRSLATNIKTYGLLAKMHELPGYYFPRQHATRQELTITERHDVIMETCSVMIHDDLGNITELDPDVQNTVANLYYRYVANVFFNEETQFWFPVKSVPDPKSPDPLVALRLSVAELASLLSGKAALPKMIAGLRELKDTGHSQVYQVGVDFFLDHMKYNISNAHRKPGFVRAIERLFKKRSVREFDFTEEERRHLWQSP